MEILKCEFPLLLGKVNEMVGSYLLATRHHGGLVSRSIVIATVKALIKQPYNPSSTWSKTIPITGISDKRAITATFTISHDGDFLPMQLIYQETTVQSLPRFDFPNSFSLGMNPKHFSNTAEALKIIDEIIVLYLRKIKKRNELHLPQDHPSLLIIDVFHSVIEYNPSSTWSKTIPVTGLSDKRAITATFTISHDGDFLPMQLIYQGTTVQGLPRFDFPNSFSQGMNPKHFSNTAEILKIIDEIIVLYLRKIKKKE